jgi:predicted PurR-regulated permease PerM
MGAGQLVATTLTGLFLVITLTMYFLAGLPTLKGFCLRFLAGSRRRHAGALVDEILLRTGRYMLANVATSVIAGLATFVWLEVWGVPYPAALGVFVALMDLIPLVGSTGRHPLTAPAGGAEGPRHRAVAGHLSRVAPR